MIKVKGVLCYIYIALWIFYYLQDLLMIKGIIAQLLLVMLMIMSFYAFFQLNFYYNIRPYLKWLNVVLLVITIYGLFLFFSGIALYPDEFNVKTGLQFAYLQRYYISVLPIYAFYFYSLKGQLSDKNIHYVFAVLFAFTILMYYQNYFLVSQMIEREEITNNMGYRFVPLIPMLALVKMKDMWKYIFLMAIFAFIMAAMKRGAILVGSIALLLYLEHHLKVRSPKQFFYIMILSIVLLGFIYFYVMNLYETSDYFKSRYNNTLEGDTSLRSWIYSHYYDFFIHRTTGVQFLFGCGADATYLKLGEYAHNDWLEFAINQGIFGVILYFLYWAVFVKEWYDYQGQLELKQTLGDIIIIYFIVSWFSMSFDGMPIAATLCIGYCLGKEERNRNRVVVLK